MEISENIKESVKDTVGYSECSNKQSFIVGCQVAFRKSEEFYNARIKELTEERNIYKNANESVLSDMKTIVNIFSKYERLIQD